jgi:subtilisin-like proprotein convertase family protein
MLDPSTAPRRLRAALSAAAATLLFAAAPAAADTFSNPFRFAIPSGSGTQGNAFPYPSTIDVEGLQTHVQKATVTLHGFAHQCSIDVDVLLVSPSGQTSLLTSDAGDCANEVPLRPGVDLTFDDDAVKEVPCLDLHSTPPRLLGGTYAPTDYSPPANGIQSTCNPFSDLDHGTPPPPGAPGPLADVFTGLTKPLAGWGHSLATFINSDPNGVWKLYVTDQYDRSVGEITGGWSLNLTTSPVPVTPPPSTPPRQPNIAPRFTTSGFRSKQKALKQKAVIAVFSSSVAGNLSGGGSMKANSKTFRFKPLKGTVAANQKMTIKFKLSKSALKALKAAFAKHRKPQAQINITVTAASGLMTTLTKTVTLTK